MTEIKVLKLNGLTKEIVHFENMNLVQYSKITQIFRTSVHTGRLGPQILIRDRKPY